jgi:hypothetical protein
MRRDVFAAAGTLSPPPDRQTLLDRTEVPLKIQGIPSPKTKAGRIGCAFGNMAVTESVGSGQFPMCESLLLTGMYGIRTEW